MACDRDSFIVIDFKSGQQVGGRTNTTRPARLLAARDSGSANKLSPIHGASLLYKPALQIELRRFRDGYDRYDNDY